MRSCGRPCRASAPGDCQCRGPKSGTFWLCTWARHTLQPRVCAPPLPVGRGPLHAELAGNEGGRLDGGSVDHAALSSYCDSDEHAPHLPQPALMSFERSPALATIAPSGSRMDFIHAAEGGGWSSSGVPLIGTNGTTNGYTPIATSRSHIARISSRVSPRPASREVLTCARPNTATAASKALR